MAHAKTIEVLMLITSILIDPVEPFALLSPGTAELFVGDRKGFEATARDWTEKFAV
jgi:hypothetical protein